MPAIMHLHFRPYRSGSLLRGRPSCACLRWAGLLCLAFLLWAASAMAVELTAMERTAVSVPKGKSVILRGSEDIERVALTSPEVAEVRLLSPRAFYLSGKAVGSTDLMLWGRQDRLLQVYDVTVANDLSPLKAQIHEMLPEERNIRVHPTQGSIALSGSVSSPESLATAMSLAESYAPGKVVNLLSVAGVHQIMLEVRVAEMSRNLMRRLGFNFTWFNIQNLSTEMAASFLGGITSLTELSVRDTPAGRFQTLERNFSPSLNSAFSVRNGDDVYQGFVDALKSNGLIKIMAEPNLTCLSGQTADFLAGGEFPYPVVGALGQIEIEYKQFGVGLSFTPTVLGGGKISLAVQPSVSELDFSNAVLAAGTRVPALNIRRASTTVELLDGQTFAIAGLINDSVRQGVDKFPGLGEIPMLGVLFRSSEFRRNETELVIIVTPRLAKPLDMAKQTLPTDGYIPPSGLEFYLLGALEGKRRPAASNTGGSGAMAVTPAELTASGAGGGFDGEFGYKP